MMVLVPPRGSKSRSNESPSVSGRKQESILLIVDLTCVASGSTDADGDTLSYSYEWTSSTA